MSLGEQMVLLILVILAFFQAGCFTFPNLPVLLLSHMHTQFPKPIDLLPTPKRPY